MNSSILPRIFYIKHKSIYTFLICNFSIGKIS